MAYKIVFDKNGKVVSTQKHLATEMGQESEYTTKDGKHWVSKQGYKWNGTVEFVNGKLIEIRDTGTKTVTSSDGSYTMETKAGKRTTGTKDGTVVETPVEEDGKNVGKKVVARDKWGAVSFELEVDKYGSVAFSQKRGETGKLYDVFAGDRHPKAERWDGAAEYRDGKLVEKTDFQTVTTALDGSKVALRKDGTTITEVRTKDGGKILEVKDPDGCPRFKVVADKDGNVLSYKRAGEEEFKKEGAVWRSADGEVRKDNVLLSGVKLVEKNDARTIHNYADGTRKIEKANGQIINEEKEGTLKEIPTKSGGKILEARDKDGRFSFRVETDKAGKVTSIRENGGETLTSKDGKRWASANGKEVFNENIEVIDGNLIRTKLDIDNKPTDTIRTIKLDGTKITETTGWAVDRFNRSVSCREKDTVYTNGSKLKETILKDGSKRITGYDAQGHTTFDLGLDKNGKTIWSQKRGESVFVPVEGGTKSKSEKTGKVWPGQIEYKDGKFLEIEKGFKRTTSPDGASIAEFENGKKVTRTKDGTTIEKPTKDGGRELVAKNVNGAFSYKAVFNREGMITETQVKGGDTWKSLDGKHWKNSSGEPWTGRVELKDGKYTEFYRPGESNTYEVSGRITKDRKDGSITITPSKDGGKTVVGRDNDGNTNFRLVYDKNGDKVKFGIKDGKLMDVGNAKLTLNDDNLVVRLGRQETKHRLNGVTITEFLSSPYNTVKQPGEKVYNPVKSKIEINASKTEFKMRTANGTICEVSKDKATIQDGAEKTVRVERSKTDGKLYLEFLEKTGHWSEKREVSSMKFNAQQGLVVTFKDNNHTREYLPCGGYIDREPKLGRPSEVRDANGKMYKYEWGEDPIHPKKVSHWNKDGSDLVVYRQEHSGDRMLKIATSHNLIGSDHVVVAGLKLAAAFKISEIGADIVVPKVPNSYKIEKDLREKASNSQLATGITIKSLSLGFCEPLQASAIIEVDSSGTLSIKYPPETVNGSIDHHIQVNRQYVDGTKKTIVHNDSDEEPSTYNYTPQNKWYEDLKTAR